MRPAALFALAILMPLPVPTAAAAAPDVGVVLPALFAFITPGQPEVIDGTMSLRFGDDASCTDSIPYGFRVTNQTAGAAVTIETANSSIPGTDVHPGGTVERPVKIRLDVAATNEAFSRIDASIEVRTAACGTVAANRTVSQTGARVAFVPNVALRLMDESNAAWHVQATNLGNARVRLPWITRQPELGRVLVGGSVGIDGPEGPSRTVDISVAKGRPDLAHDVLFDEQIVYDGNFAYHPEERPALGTSSLRLHDGTGDGGSSQKSLQYGILALAVLIVVAAFFAGRRLRRPKGP